MAYAPHRCPGTRGLAGYRGMGFSDVWMQGCSGVWVERVGRSGRSLIRDQISGRISPDMIHIPDPSVFKYPHHRQHYHLSAGIQGTPRVWVKNTLIVYYMAILDVIDVIVLAT